MYEFQDLAAYPHQSVFPITKDGEKRGLIFQLSQLPFKSLGRAKRAGVGCSILLPKRSPTSVLKQIKQDLTAALNQAHDVEMKPDDIKLYCYVGERYNII